METRQKAQALIMAGEVVVDDQRVDKAGAKFDFDCNLRIKNQIPYVSRGGLKLKSAHESFRFDIAGLNFMDVGASTGGFTDFLLQNGARNVFCLDVGTNQLHEKLRQDSRVISAERTHILDFQSNQLPFSVHAIVMDVSFISVTRLFEHLSKLAITGHQLICLIKPQFEVGREAIGAKGVVKDPEVTLKALRIAVEALRQSGYRVLKLDYCKIPGPQGNVEYFVFCTHCPSEDCDFDQAEICRVVENRFADPKMPFCQFR